MIWVCLAADQDVINPHGNMGMPCNKFSIALWKTPGADQTPNGSLSYG